MLGALADGVHVLVVAAGEAVVDQNPPPHVQPGHARQVNVGPDSCRDNHHVAIQCIAVLELETRYALVAKDCGGQFFQMKAHSQVFQALLQQLAGLGVQLRVHQPAHEVDDVNLQPPVHQSARRFQPQQAAADDRRPTRSLRVLDDGCTVVQGAEHE